MEKSGLSFIMTVQSGRIAPIQAVPAVATTENFVVMFLIEMDISLPLAKAFITPKTVLIGQTPGTTEVMMLLHSVGISWLQYPRTGT